MLFPTHLAAGYVLGRVTGHAVPLVVLGAALPDLVDKPLAAVGIVDLYHTVGHSGFVLVALGAVTVLSGREELRAVTVGVASHLALDAGHVVLNGRAADAAFLGWPVVLPPDPPALAPLAFARVYLATPAFFLESALWVALVWVVLTGRWQDRQPT